MVLVMIANYVVAALISWLLFQTPILAMFHAATDKLIFTRSTVVVAQKKHA